MKLNRETYEAWLLDRMEGVLTPAQEAALDAFLLEHPDLEGSADPLPRVNVSNEHFPGKEQLHRTFPPTGTPDCARLDDFLVARLEEDLTSEQEQELAHYLYEHPEAERHALLMAMAKVPNEPMAFTEKEKLHRHFPPQGLPDLHRLTDFLIAELEGDLTAEQQKALRAYLADNAIARQERELVHASRVQAELLPYPKKSDLKKREVRVFALWPRLAVAASVLLVLSAGWWFLREDSKQDGGLVRVEPREIVQRPSSSSTTHASVESAPIDQIHQEDPSATQPAEVSDAAQGKEPPTVGKVKPGKTNAHTPEEKPEQELEQTPQVPAAQVPLIDRLPVKEPTLARLPDQPVPEPMGVSPSSTSVATDQDLAVVDTRNTGQSLGTFVANAVRGEVLSAPKRAEVLDGQDALAFADKAIGTVTGGRGGVQLQRNASGERLKLRLGRNLSFSASRNR